MSSTLTIPRTRAGPVDDQARLHVRVEQHRQRVLEGRPPVEQGGGGLDLVRRDQAGGQPVAVDPADRPLLRVDDQDVLERLLVGDPPRDRAVRAHRRRHDRRQRQLPDPEQAEPLEAAVRAHEPGDEVRRGVREDLRRRSVLGDDPAGLEDRDDVAHLDRLVDVVGDEQDRLGEPLLEAQELVLEALADDRVDGAERLVHEHDRRVGGQRPGDADALPLAAGELGRVAPGIRRGLQAHDREQLLGAGRQARLRPAQQPRHRDDVLLDRLVREQAGLLDHVADAAAELRDVARRRVDAVEQDAARRGLDQAVDHLERRRLAAAGRPDEHADPSRRDREREVVDRAGGAGPRRPGVVRLRDVVELDRRGSLGRGGGGHLGTPPDARRLRDPARRGTPHLDQAGKAR